jgi:hypothetical protein
LGYAVVLAIQQQADRLVKKLILLFREPCDLRLGDSPYLQEGLLRIERPPRKVDGQSMNTIQLSKWQAELLREAFAILAQEERLRMGLGQSQKTPLRCKTDQTRPQDIREWAFAI